MRLGVYEIIAAIGSGGMGDVYRARDTKLDRDVAIKVLPEAFAHDRDRLARFEREAKVLASLNHPHIAGIYGLETGPALPGLPAPPAFIVMELVEGEDLSQRIARGSIPIDQVLLIAKQIAEALEAAHEHGIIHRDLKPANVKVRDDDTVKVLDFGLAKAIDVAGGPGGNDLANSPTLTSPAMTQAGMILGTAAYMSPEQAAGKPADKRSDLWSFGVVVMEMLTARPVFSGETVAHVLAAVLKSEPDWTTLPAETPDPLRRLLRRCLEKDRKRRLDSAAAVRLDIEEAGSAARLPQADAGRSWVKIQKRRAVVVPIVAASVGALLAGGVAFWNWPRRDLPPIVRFTETPRGNAPLNRSLSADPGLAISPDGKRIAYVAGATALTQQVYVRALDQLESVSIGGVGRRRGVFFSPDGQWLGYSDGTLIMKAPVAGGPPATVCTLEGLPRGASWGEDGTIVFATNVAGKGLFRVPAGGGIPEVLTTPDAAKGDSLHELPEILPGGRGVLFTILRTAGSATAARAQVAVLDLETRQWKVVIPQGSSPHYVATGHLLFAVGGTVRAVPFNLDRLEVTGEPMQVVGNVLTQDGSQVADFSVARNGTLVYIDGGLQILRRLVTMVWVNRKGGEEAIQAPPRVYAYARLSPDGTRIALDARDQQNDIWIWDLARRTLQRLTNDPGFNRLPVWTPDGKRIAFSAERDGVESIYWQAFDGSGTMERLSSGTQPQTPQSFSPDGKRLIFGTPTNVPYDLGVISLEPTRTARMLWQTRFSEPNAEVSPDGRWLAYESDESGQPEVYVRPFPDLDMARRQVSTGGGTRPLWSRDGRELFYYVTPDTIMAVPIRPGSDLTWLSPQPAVKGPSSIPLGSGRHYDVSANGQRFLMFKDAPTPGEQTAAPEIHVVLNWMEELKQRVPTR